MSEFERKYYENEAFWVEEALSDSLNTIRVKETAAFIPQDVTSLLDVGCGNGIFTNLVAAQRPNIKVVGFDRSEEALKYIKTDKLQGDITNIPAADNTFDCITCLEVIEHLPLPTYKKAMEEIARVTKKYAIISVPYKEKQGFGMTQCPHCKTIFNREMHLNWFDDNTMQTLFKNTALTFVKSFTTVNNRPPLGYSIIEKYHLSNHNVKEFTSPICPVCGYEKPEFETATTQRVKSDNKNKPLKQRIKDAVKKVWPKGKEVPGFWIIALYEKK
jgi:ubiquinone/menaquinone biosynthesis C-methylase UbiE